MKTKTNIISKTFNELPTLARAGIFGVGGFLLFRFGKNQYDLYEKKKREKLLAGANVPVITGKDSNGAPIGYNINLGQRASMIDQAYSHNDYFGFSEDEETMIKAIADVPREMMPALADTYFALSGNNLKEVFNSALDSEQLIRVYDKLQF
jgi:hypothetical protein